MLLFYTVSAFGLCYAIGHSRISLPFRNVLGDLHGWKYLIELLECPACFGWWIGFWTGLVYPSLVPLQVATPAAVFALAFYTCGANFLLGRATGLIKE